MDPYFWGSAGWKMLYSIAMGYPEQRKDVTEQIQEQYYNFFHAYGPVIPCVKCSKEYQEYLDKHPIDSSLKRGRKEVVRWLYKMKKKSIDEAIKRENDNWEKKKAELTAKKLSSTIIERRKCQYVKTEPSWSFEKVYDYYSHYLKPQKKLTK